jgi:phage gpG-like protein
MQVVEQSLTQAVASIREPVTNMKPLMNRLSAFLLRCAMHKFDKGGGAVPWTPSRRALLAGRKTLNQHGYLRNSLRRMHDSGMAGIFTNYFSARIHEEGGVIRPRKAKALAIPIDPISIDKTPAMFPGAFIPRTGKDGERKNVILWRPAKGEKAISIFLLLKSVTMPARPYIAPTDQELQQVDPLLSQWIVNGRLA